MRGKVSFTVAALIALTACSGKKRPFGHGVPDGSKVSAMGESDGDTSAPDQPFPESARASEDEAGGIEPSQREAAAVGGIQPVDPMGADGDIGASAADVACPGCSLSGSCIAIGAQNQDNPCQVCDPQRDTASWSSNDGAVCDDGLFCTVEDTCRDSTCGGVARVCEDGVSCNGVSVCLEDQGTCSAGENQCADLQLCNVESDECVSTCEGCVVDGVCVTAGSAPANNTCLVCDPMRSTARLSVNEGEPCGSAATECSAQDTCNAQGQCAPNHLSAGTICGALGSQCDADDTCNGVGQCLRRVATNGAACDDGQFCTVDDRCQGGQCTSGSARNCGQNQSCDEAQNACISVLSGPGESCSNSADCESGPCTFWFIDSDGDGYGSGAPTGACGAVQPSIRLLPGQTLTLDEGDCCPSDPGSFPGFTPSTVLPIQTQPDSCGSFDRDCSGRVENTLQDVLDVLGGPVDGCFRIPASVCQSLAGSNNNFAVWLGDVPPCGEFGTQNACQFVNGACAALIGGPLDNRCR
jgi:hypothetical protein